MKNWNWLILAILVAVFFIVNERTNQAIRHDEIQPPAPVSQPKQLAKPNPVKQYSVSTRELCKAHPKWSLDDCELIAKKEIRIGMLAEQAELAWGKPESINSTTTGFGTSEQWVYPSGSYVYFDNGRLRSIQQSR